MVLLSLVTKGKFKLCLWADAGKLCLFFSFFEPKVSTGPSPATRCLCFAAPWDLSTASACHVQDYHVPVLPFKGRRLSPCTAPSWIIFKCTLYFIFSPIQRLTSLQFPSRFAFWAKPHGNAAEVSERMPALLAVTQAADPGAVTRGLSGTGFSPLSIKNN